ncbi:MAG: dienelactone hydrolase family protein [Prolixibacteraceae bacterium]|nr:dienelactone hydrolase family protein [Prolixibacteraceae bacterium]
MKAKYYLKLLFCFLLISPFFLHFSMAKNANKTNAKTIRTKYDYFSTHNKEDINSNNFEKGKDPFQPYQTGKSPQILKDFGEEVKDGVRLRKVVFYSREVQTATGKDTSKIYAVIARPAKSGRYPGLLVLHGGGGFAEIDKAKKWAKQGYIALLLDEPGIANPEKAPFSSGPWKKFAYGESRFIVIPDITNSTIFDGVLSAVQGLYLLRSQPGVIKGKIGIVGISWGGYLTTIVSGLANKMVNASFSVFGSGFYDEGSLFLKELDKMSTADRATWLKYLDAGRRSKAIKTHFFIAAAANDNWFYPPAVMATLRSIKGPVNNLFSPNSSHKIELPGGTTGANPEQPGWLSMEQVYFDYFLKGIGQPLPKIQEIKTEKTSSGNVLVRFKVSSLLSVSIAQISYSSIVVGWTERKWETVPAVKSGNGWYMVEVPAKELRHSFDCFATISDSRPVSVSSYLIRYE